MRAQIKWGDPSWRLDTFLWHYPRDSWESVPLRRYITFCIWGFWKFSNIWSTSRKSGLLILIIGHDPAVRFFWNLVSVKLSPCTIDCARLYRYCKFSRFLCILNAYRYHHPIKLAETHLLRCRSSFIPKLYIIGDHSNSIFHFVIADVSVFPVYRCELR